METDSRHQILISFQVCKNCKYHGWNTRHDEYKYEEHFDTLSKLIRNKLAGVRIAKNVVPIHLHKIAGQLQLQNKFYDQNKQDLVHFPEIGAFQISVFNIIVFSKLKSNVWPSYTRVIALLTQIIQDYRAGKSIQPFKRVGEDRLRSISLKEAQPKKIESSSKKLSVLRNSDLIPQSKANSNLKVRLVKNTNALVIDKRAPIKLQKVSEQRVQRFKRFERPERESEQEGFQDNKMRVSIRKQQQLQNRLKVKLKEFQIRQKQLAAKQKEIAQSHSAQVQLLRQQIVTLNKQVSSLTAQNSQLQTRNKQLLKRLQSQQSVKRTEVKVVQQSQPKKLPKYPLKVKLTNIQGHFRDGTEGQGYIDPYLQVTVNKLKLRTQVIDEGGADVKWKKSIQQQFKSGKDVIKFQAFDQNLMTSELLGTVQISADNLLKADRVQSLKLFLGKEQSGQIKFQVAMV